MKSRVLRWTLLGLFVALLAGATYVLWVGESVSRSLSASARTFDQRAESLIRAVMELRMGQQAYVAAGQGDEFWGSKVATRIAAMREELAAVRTLAVSAGAQSALDDAGGALGDFERLDARAREYARGNQRLLASDLIFSDGLEKTDEMLRAIDSARSAEREAALAVAGATRQRELVAAALTSAAALLLGFLLVPVPRAEALPPAVEISAPPETPVHIPAEIRTPLDEDVLILRDARDPAPPPQVPVPVSMRETETDARDPLDLGAVASLCTELARIVDTRALPAVLERTATVLDANGVVLWIADPDGRELNPIVTHGYPPQLVTRLGTIPRDAQNATAAAFRTALLQTVNADSISNGAIAVPLVTPGGCVGVMAAEVRHGGEKQDAKLAAAAIVAAQLATLVGPPSSRGQSRAEAANA